jgi:hypothetical protein
MARLRLSIDSDLPPDRVLAAAEELSGRRSGLWRLASRKFLELYEATGTYSEIGMRVTKRDGGSHIEIFSDRRPNGLPGLVIGTVVQVVGRRTVLESLRRALEGAAGDAPDAPAPATPRQARAAATRASIPQRTYEPPAALADSVWCHVPSSAELGELLIRALSGADEEAVRPRSRRRPDGTPPSSRRGR